jgi:hypothetical protein
MSDFKELIDKLSIASYLVGASSDEDYPLHRKRQEASFAALTDAVTALQSRTERAEKELEELQFIARRLYLSNASKSTCTMYEQYLDRTRLSQSAGNVSEK